MNARGQVVKRYYVHPAGNVPEPDYDPNSDEIIGRDPDDDALVAMSDDPDPEDFQEVREVPVIDEEDSGGDE